MVYRIETVRIPRCRPQFEPETESGKSTFFREVFQSNLVLLINFSNPYIRRFRNVEIILYIAKRQQHYNTN